MFGLMRAKKCGMSDAEKHFRRLNYCGTCKTIGSLYGQKARLVLNHDTVFLAEILAALGGERVADWQKSYQSFNCLNLPKSEMPFSLQFAATTNVVLTEFKLADHSEDEGKRRYEFARRAFSKEFQKARALLKDWDFPLGEVEAILSSQAAREREAAGSTADEILSRLAEPTAEATAIFFREGVKGIGRPELAPDAFALGHDFGELIYLVDAFEDYEKDLRAGQFNALRAAFDLKENVMTAAARRKIAARLDALESRIAEKIARLPLAENQKTLFAARLADNLQRKLKIALPVVVTQRACAPARKKRKKTFAARWSGAREKAANLARGFSWQMPVVFLFVFVFALVAPAQSREARSARECFDLSFNLMTLGAIFGAVLAFPKTILAGNLEDEEAKQRRRERWCEWCDCCCCDCEGCCDGVDCCSNCGCDGCCCCDGCCDCSCDC